LSCLAWNKVWDLGIVKIKFLTTIIFFWIAPLNAFGEMYKWVDENGRIQFTDDVLRVPESKRESAKQKPRNEGSYSPKTTEGQINYITDSVEAYNKKINEIYEPALEAQKNHIRVLKDSTSTKAEILLSKRVADKASRLAEQQMKKHKLMFDKKMAEMDK
jgi:hypothetical protein